MDPPPKKKEKSLGPSPKKMWTAKKEEETCLLFVLLSPSAERFDVSHNRDFLKFFFCPPIFLSF